MKTRNDFVSNSSSSSYVFSMDFKKYGFDEFVKNVCSQCDENYPGKKLKDPELYAKNEAILKYCLRYFELLHLGRIKLERKREIIRREKNEKPEDSEYSEFNIIKHDFIDRTPNPKYNEENGVARMLSEDEIEYEHDVISEPGITVNQMYMRDFIRRDWHYDKKSYAKRRKEHVERILAAIKMADAAGSDAWRTTMMASTYAITKNTIANTRDLIAAGYDVKLEKWEDIDAIEARIMAGETVFYIECGDAGEGEEDTRIYSMNDQYPFNDIPLDSVRRGDWW